MKLIGWAIIIVIAAVATMFALSNNTLITMRAWPTPFEIDIPLYLIVFTPFVVGFFMGGFVSWWHAGRSRGRARRAERLAAEELQEIDRLKNELAATKDASAGAGGRQLANAAGSP